MAALFLSVCASAQQVEKSVTASNGVAIGFLQYTPTNYSANTNTKYPLIIFLHGIGERGNGTTQLQNVAGAGIPRYIKDGHTMTFTWNGKTETFLVLSPQLSGNYGWWQSFYVDEMIKYAKQNLRIDTNRIILTGLSLGGGGVWYYAAGTPGAAKNFAAIAPVCGTCQSVNWNNIASANLPVWAFHANDDGTVPSSCTSGAIQGIESYNPAVKPYKTIWPTGQHWIWDRAFDYGYGYQNPNVYEWWLAQDKSKPVNKRPTAVAGPEQNVTLAAASATLNGSQSTDPDGTIVRYVWSFVSGPSTAKVTTPASTNGSTTVTGLTTAGTYVFELKAVDDRCDWSTAQVKVNVSTGGVNTPPVTNAGPDITITLPTNSTTLNGSTTYDKEGYVNAYEWSKVSGPAQFSIANTAAASTALTNLVEGTYVFKLTAWDNSWTNASDLVTVVVKAESTTTPPPPTSVPLVANAGSNVNLTLPANSTTLSAEASTGKIRSYSWSKESGPAQCTFANASAANTLVSNLTAGTYNFKLVVTDSSGATSTASVVVTQNAAPAGNQAAVPVPGSDMTITLPVNSVSLDGSASYDADGALKAYQWSKISGPSAGTVASATAAKTTANGLVEGVYTFRLNVWGDNWVPMGANITVTVKAATGGAANVAPIANAGADASITLPTNSFNLNATASNDPDGTIAAYAWSQVSGPSQISIANASTVSATASNLVQGAYSFRVQVTDNAGAINADTIVITVKPAPVVGNQPPVANAGADITTAAASITLNGTASSDADGMLKAYMWRQLSGPSQSSIVTMYGSTTIVNNLVAGTYKFELMVWGDNWVPRADTIVVNVTANAAAVTTSASQKVATVELAAAATEQIKGKDGVKLFPNPATSQVTVQYQGAATGAGVINTYDVTGKLMNKQTISKNQSLMVKNIDVTSLRPGIYHLELVVGNTRTTQTFVKQ